MKKYEYDFKQAAGYTRLASREWAKFLAEGRKGLSAANPGMVQLLIKRGDDHEIEVEGLLESIAKLKEEVYNLKEDRAINSAIVGAAIDPGTHKHLIDASFQMLKALHDDYWRDPGDEAAEKKADLDVKLSRRALTKALEEAVGCGNDNPGYQHCGSDVCPNCNNVI